MERRCHHIHPVCSPFIPPLFSSFLFSPLIDAKHFANRKRLCGFPPFFDDGSNMAGLFEQIMNGEFDYPDEYWAHVSEEAKDLIDNLLMVDPAARFTATQALQHPWLQGAAKDTPLSVSEQLQKTTNQAKRK